MLANGLTKARSRFVALHARCNSIVWLEYTCKALKIDDVIKTFLNKLYISFFPFLSSNTNVMVEPYLKLATLGTRHRNEL